MTGSRFLVSGIISLGRLGRSRERVVVREGVSSLSLFLVFV